MKYYIGYYSEYADEKGKFIVLAQTHAVAVAMFIRDSYNDSYKRIGLTITAVIREELPDQYRYAQ